MALMRAEQLNINKVSEVEPMDNSFKSNVNANVMDIQNLDSLRKSAINNDPGTLKEVAKQFESLFTNMLMKSMREANAAFETESPMNNNYTQFYRDMQDKQMAADMSQNGSMGLADVIVQQLSNTGGNYMPASSLQGDSNPLEHLQSGEAKNSQDDKVAASTSPVNTSPANSATANGATANGATANGATANSATANSATANDATVDSAAASANPTAESKNMNFNSPEEFVASLAPFADWAGKRLNVSPKVLLAQAALETGWGKKVSVDNKGESSHNLFNIKADKGWHGPTAKVDTLEFHDGIAKRETHQFRSYQDFEASFHDFANFLQSGQRYSAALNNSADSAQFLNGLQQAGYATDPNYAAKIQNVMQHKAFN